MSAQALEIVSFKTDEEACAALDAGLEALNKEQVEQAFTLPQLLGEPQEYAPVPGLWFKRPKMGHKLDLLRQWQAVADLEDVSNDERMVKILPAILVYCFRKLDDGTVRPATQDEVLYELFEDFDEFGVFIGFLINSKRGQEPGRPNE